MQKIKTIAFDADDTLWVNEPLFRINEEKFDSLLKEYVSHSDITEKLYQTELKNLKHFGYGIKGFVISMIETAIELTNGEIKGCDLKKIIDWGKKQIDHPVNLLDGVEEVLRILKNNYQLMVITKGDLFDQESKIARSGLADYFDIVEIVSEKEESVYSLIIEKHKLKVDEFLMVGNSLKSDILPLVNIGAFAVHIPFHTTWVHEKVESKDLIGKHYVELADIRELLTLLK
ncbi:MAG: HAD family hydrolase [Flavobacteriales bacterium]|nr:HAD family hydrolase [Flavobacteriales bacterium]